MDPNPQIFTTEDGSKTLISEKYGVPYHSKYGAVDESVHVFISAGIQRLVNNGYGSIRLLECGFGTGLNAFLAYLFCKIHPHIHIHYTGLEIYPISQELAGQLGYAQYLDKPEEEFVFLQMHACEWDQKHVLSHNYQFEKQKLGIEDMTFTGDFDLIFYDAFAPQAQPELWDEEMMRKIYRSMKTGGILCTYCAKGSFKRALKSAGFEIEVLPGPGKKREMTRAVKIK